MAKKEKVDKPIDNEIGAIIYSDGGARATYGGYGIHGYTYSDQAPTKGSGNPTQYLTNSGYIPKIDVKEKANIAEVKPIKYLNGYGSIAMPTTNNVAELAGANSGLQYAINNNLKYITVFTDSEMVVKGATEWLGLWKRNNWIKNDGQPVANRYWWEAIDDSLKSLKTNGTTVEFKWVKGHSTHLGNQLADKLATIAVLHSKENEIKNELNIDKADGYWSDSFDKSPFITQKCIYFTTKEGSIVPGEYYLGNHGKDDELLGKRTADGCYSYVLLKTPEPAIELLRNKQAKLTTDLDVIVKGRLDKLFEPGTYKDVMGYGDIVFYLANRYSYDMNFIDSEPITKELRPPRLAIRAVDAINKLKGILTAYTEGKDTNLKLTDITNIIYDIDDKGEYKLKPEYVVGFTNLSIEVNYGNNDKQEKVDICMGVDIPERNYLKRMEKLKPTINVITWMESEKMFRYATVIKTVDDIGIFCGFYSNSRYIVNK